MILSSWRDTTKKHYTSYIQRWILFCSKHNLNVFSTDVLRVLDFLTMLFHEGLAYSAINTARSALSSFLGVNDTEPVGSHSLIVRFMKGVARTRHALPRYHCIWDVNVVLDMFRMQPLAEFLLSFCHSMI